MSHGKYSARPGEKAGLSPAIPPSPCRNCKITICTHPPRFEARLFNLILAKSPDAGGCALTTLAVKSSSNRGPGEGLKSGSGEIVGPGSGTLLINPGAAERSKSRSVCVQAKAEGDYLRFCRRR